jgi:ribosome-associated toxin RatA of RatAB toxin-antitoxin module
MLAKTFTYSNTVLVPYTAAQVFAVVDDVGNYHRFLPNCTGSGVTTRTRVVGGESAAEPSSERVLGYMDLAFLGMRYRLDSDNIHTAPSRIDMRLLKGPFKTLTGQWTFTPLGDAGTVSGCKVSYAMQWQYDSALLAMTLGQRFESIAKQLLDAFIAETARRAA